MRTILHIGSDKTGSTALQFAFAEYRDDLRRSGVCYPKLDDRPDHRCLIDSGLIPSSFGEGCEVVVLSSEALWRLSKDQIGSVLRRLPAGPAQVVAYLREPGSYAEAAFLQRCRMCRSERELAALLQVLKIPARVNPIARRAIRRFAQLQTWNNNLTGQELLVLPYIPSSDIVADFCSHVGLEKVLPVVASRSTKRQNPTLGLTAIHASVLVRERSGAQVQEKFLRFCAQDDDVVAHPMLTTPAIRTFIRERALRIIDEFDGVAGDLSSLHHFEDRPSRPAKLNMADAVAYLDAKLPRFEEAASGQ